MGKEQTIKGLKIVFQHLSRYKSDLIILSVLGVISAIANGMVPYLVGRFFDSILDLSKIFIGTRIEMPLFLFFILVWVLVQLIANFVDWKSNVKSSYLGETVYSNYIIKGFGTLLELPLSFHKNRKMGDIFDRISRTASWMQRVASNVIIDLTPQFLSILVALLISFYVNYFLACFLLLGVLIYVIILFKIAPPLIKLQRKMNKAYNTAFGDAYDAVFNIQAVKQGTTEKYEQKKLFRNFYLKASKFWKKMQSIWQGMNFYQRLIIAFTQLVIFSLSIFFIQKGTMTIGELVMFNGYAAMLFGPFVRLGQNWQTVQNGLVAIERSEEILSVSKEKYIPKNAVILSGIKGEIVFKNVSFVYKKKTNQILDDISFEVGPGEIVALVGESGVGKSTLVDLISGYYFPQEGEVLIDGHNIKNIGLKFLRSKIAIVPQEVILFNDTIKNNIAYGKFSATEKEIKRAAERSYASEFIESFPKKYKQIVGERGIKLSVGQKQRVAIARAILRDPKILILDEPTSALDAKSEKFIQESLEKLMKNRTTFIIAHRLSTVRRADKILVLENGRIVEQGRHQDLIKIPNGVYHQFYKYQIGLL
ncbi:ABC transporter ATP-binding protein [Patescibacteria group bacterium]|nr:ABC transporter ATP-binding protein [Patescibacteria group bacterium]